MRLFRPSHKTGCGRLPSPPKFIVLELSLKCAPAILYDRDHAKDLSEA